MPDGDRQPDLSFLADTDPLVERYRTVLPESEYAALYNWSTSFYPFQRKWLFEDERLAVANKSRQIGWSHTTAAVGVLWGAFHGELTTIISVGDRESREVLDKCARHVAVLQDLGSKWAKTWRSSTEEIVFHSGGRIVALPSSAGRSFSGNVFLDEFAYQTHATTVWDNAAPVTMLDFRMRVVSTPNGVGNEFHGIWDRATKQQFDDPEGHRVRWATHEIPLQVALAQGYPVDIAYCWELAHGDPRLFDQMFNCSFLDSVLQYLSTEKINGCRWARPLLPDGRGLYYAGLDIGREVDRSCLVVVKQYQEVSEVVHVEQMKRTDSDGLEAMIAWAFKRYDLRRICIDSTGLGTFPAERIRNRHGDRLDVPHRRNKVEAIDFTPKSKEALATNLYTVFTGQKVRLPAEDDQLPYFERRNVDGKGEEVGELLPVNVPGTAALIRRDLASIRRIITPSGNVTYDAPRTKDGHADSAWALALALFAVDKTHPMIAALQERMGKMPGSF